MRTEANSFGNLGIVSSSLIRGWAVIDDPKIIPEVIIYADDCELCRAKANIFREDLLNSKLHPTGYCGFDIRDFNQEQLQRAKQIRAIILQTNKELARSPLLLKNKMSSYEDLEYCPLVFIHIPKTAGTSFRNAAQKYFGESNTLKDYEKNSPDTSKVVLDTIYNGKKTFFVNELISRKIRFFSGHFSALSYLDILDANVKWCVLFRNPVQRVISEYKHHVRYGNYKESLEYFCNSEDNCNTQSKRIKGLALDSCFIGITEAYDKSIDLFKASVGYEFEKLELNVNAQGLNSPHYEGYFKLIEKNNRLDLELYSDVCKIFNQRLRDYNIAP